MRPRWMRPAGRALQWLALTACAAPARTPAESAPPALAAPPAAPASRLVELSPPTRPAPGLTLRHVQRGERSFRVAELDLRHAELALYGQSPGAGDVRTFAELHDYLEGRGRELIWATNAGIFSPEHRPLGLHVERGVERQAIDRAHGDGNFYLLPNGVFSVTAGRASVVPTDRVVDGPRDLATQSGPLLLDAGVMHPAFREDSPNILLRSGVGVRDPHTVVFAISEGGVRFWELAALFRDDLGCRDALYLDGVISQWVDPDHPPSAAEGAFAGLFVVTVPAR